MHDIDSTRQHALDADATTRPRIAGRIVVLLGNRPNLDVHRIAGRAEREGRQLILVTLSNTASPCQVKILQELARLSWSWMELLSYGVAHRLDVVRDDDEVIIAARGRERRRLVSSLRSTRREAGGGTPP
jgi:hypothetical protein